MSSKPAPDISSIFGEILRRYRVRQEISQEELAYLAGVDRTFVSRLERGVRQPTVTTLIGIGMALGVPAADMVRDTEKEYLKQSDVARLGRQIALLKEARKGYTKSRQRKS